MLFQHTPRRLAIVTGASRRRGIGAVVCLALAEDAGWITGQIIRSTGEF